MREPFFPLNPQQVVPLFKLDDTDELTCLQIPKPKPGDKPPRVRIIRVAMGSIFKATVVKIDPVYSKSEYV